MTWYSRLILSAWPTFKFFTKLFRIQTKQKKTFLCVRSQFPLSNCVTEIIQNDFFLSTCSQVADSFEGNILYYSFIVQFKFYHEKKIHSREFLKAFVWNSFIHDVEDFHYSLSFIIFCFEAFMHRFHTAAQSWCSWKDLVAFYLHDAVASVFLTNLY